LVSRVVRDGQSRVALGLVLGVFASLVLKRAIASQVFGVSVTDPVTYVASILLLGAVAMLATLAPAVRASRVDPAVAVRDA
jgi:ABC-type antimicrobial peptide transport system permease subunit